MSTVAYSTFNYYFVKRRISAMSLVQLLKGAILVGHPILVGFFMNSYGFRGTATIIAAINANCLIAMCVMHPVEWHYKEIKIRVIENEIRPCKYRNDFISTFLCVHVHCSHKIKCLFCLILILVMTAKIDIAETRNDSAKIKILNASEKQLKPCTIINKIVHFLDLKLLNDPIYVNIVFGLAFALFSDSMFSTLLPTYMMDKGFTKVCAFLSHSFKF